MNTPNVTPEIEELFRDRTKKITVLTGAGISAESGIPTFRGPEGYWTIGSSVYMPEQVATLTMFMQYPQEVWEWYLYRLGVCLHAEPNAGHQSLAGMEQCLGDRFTLITQNIDNLHIRAGNSLQRTFQIHGNINFTRCGHACNAELTQLADELKVQRDQKELRKKELALLRCRNCGEWLRPHVLWFDEYYDEEHFSFDSSMQAAGQTDLLLVVGTSGATTLPSHVATRVYQQGGTILDVNPEKNPFSELARSSPGGMALKMPASAVLPGLLDYCPS